jgi:class 3 adenylate cyclase/CheY-like chemotaxis protein
MAIARRILLIQADAKAAQDLSTYFKKRGDQVWQTDSIAQAETIIERCKTDLVFIDLHLPGNSWEEVLTLVKSSLPSIKVIITNNHPDLRRELQAKEQGIKVFLRMPFTPSWIEKAIRANQTTAPSLLPARATLPKVRMSMRVKITFPYVLLAMMFAVAAAFLVSRYVLESMRDRFVVQLIDTGKITADWMVQEESRLLETLRLVANTEGLPEAILAADTAQVQDIVLPIAVNYQEEAIEILNASGESVLSLYHRTGGNIDEYDAIQSVDTLAFQPFVQHVVQGRIDDRGDKYAGLVNIPMGDYFFISGPIQDDEGKLAGIILVGNSLNRLVRQIREDTLAHATIYTLDGHPIVTTTLLNGTNHPLPTDLAVRLLQNQDMESPVREIQVASSSYAEILGPWEVRGGQDLGIIGTSLAQNFITRPSLVTRFQAIGVVLVAVLGVILLGIYLAHQIISPLSRVVQASVQVAKGNLEVKVPSQGNDEVMVLAHAFNYMVTGLQEGSIYRDLLGRTVSPEVREAMRQSFASGDLRLEGQSAEATVLMSDIRGFTSLSEKEEPTTILKWLNEYYGAMVPVVTSFGGVVDKFEGDAVLSFFGILPRPLPAEMSAYQACKAGLEMLEVVEKLNARRAARGEPPLVTGIGINTGTLIAGGLGAADRLNYTVIGDAVNTTQRIEGVTRSFYESGIVISESTLTALKEHREEFHFEPLGEHAFKGKRELQWLYRLYPGSKAEPVVDTP